MVSFKIILVLHCMDCIENVSGSGIYLIAMCMIVRNDLVYFNFPFVCLSV